MDQQAIPIFRLIASIRRLTGIFNYGFLQWFIGKPKPESWSRYTELLLSKMRHPSSYVAYHLSGEYLQVLFESDINIDGILAKPGDIVFSYQ